MNDVQFTLLLTLGLVVLVIFLFLRNLPATVIPSLALPVSIVGTFAIMSVLGYSLDNLSLMALTLAVGFVVDDAIVMLENIVRHMERGEPRLEAAFRGVEGGRLHHRLHDDLARRGLPARALHGRSRRAALPRVRGHHRRGDPRLRARLPHPDATPLLAASSSTRPPRSATAACTARPSADSSAGLRTYERGLVWSLDHARTVVVFSIAVLVAMVPLWRAVPKGFLPSEDTGRAVINTEAAEGTSFEAMSRAQRQVGQIASAHPAVEAANSRASSRGTSGSGFVFMKLREGKRPHVDQVIADLRRDIASVPGLRTFVVNPPPISLASGGAGRAQYAFTLQDADPDVLYRAAPALEARMRDLPGLVDVTSDLRLSSPRVTVEIDRQRAAALQVSPLAVEDALFTAFGTRTVSTINAPEDQYDVVMELDPSFRADPASLSLVYVRSAGGSSSRSTRSPGWAGASGRSR